MIPMPPLAPIVATLVVPIATALKVSNNANGAVEVEHMVAPMVPPLDVDAATKMMSIENRITIIEIHAEVNGFFAESTYLTSLVIMIL
ncbi:hypothetical protein D1007_44843 [Hordeum vulgare]|nr:hypothetical protein D1007_44843 [Hordeum vulgare]